MVTAKLLKARQCSDHVVQKHINILLCKFLTMQSHGSDLLFKGTVVIIID